MFRQRRDQLTLLWLAAVLGWSVIRCFAVAQWLADYGVDPLWYLVVDVSSSIPYGWCSANVIGALYDGRRRAAVGWAVPTVLGFIAPDVYIFTVGQSLPWPTYVVVLGFGAVAGALAVRAGRNSLEQRRRAELAPVTVAVPAN
jgi:hypothetical protein